MCMNVSLCAVCETNLTRIAVCEMRWLSAAVVYGRSTKCSRSFGTRELSHSNHWIRNRRERLPFFQRHRWEFVSLSISKRCWNIYLIPVILLLILLLITRRSNQLQLTELIWWKAKCIRFVQIESVLLPKFGNCSIPHEKIRLRADSQAFAFRFIPFECFSCICKYSAYNPSVLYLVHSCLVADHHSVRPHKASDFISSFSRIPASVTNSMHFALVSDLKPLKRQWKLFMIIGTAWQSGAIAGPSHS